MNNLNSIENIRYSFINFLEKKLNLSTDIISNLIEINLNTDLQKQQFGDLSTNAPLVLAKQLKINPRNLAQEIIDSFSHPLISKLEIAGPGFINIFLLQDSFKQIAQEISNQENYFKLSEDQKKLNYNIEFVSANPTGPLHLGHGRGGIIGDVLGNILKFLGHKVTKEFYINDAGSQIQKLGLSFKIRCEQVLGLNSSLPEDAYHGQYLLDLAQKAVDKFGKDILDNNINFFENYAKEQLLINIKNTLTSYGINFDTWFSEKILHENGSIEHALQILEKNNYLYQQDNATWFKSTEFGDDKDRVVKKGSGELTYVAADIAYLENKIDRNFNKLIMILGQDHHSYVVRLKAILQALNRDKDILDVILYQMVSLKENGASVKMSKRAGKILDLKEIIELVGPDVARFFYLNKKSDAHLDFDIDLALKKTEENPVYYIQYAYVRINSILEKAYQEEKLRDINLTDIIHIDLSENLIIKKIASLRDLLMTINKNYQTHLLTYYVIELAQLFHSYYGSNRIIDITNINQSRGRLLIAKLIQDTLKTCFDLLNISAPQSM